jgi:broad specificity phosphatase PhoE
LERELVRLLLIRHGQTTSNVLHLLDTATPGAALTDVGMQQADGLVGALCDESIDVLMASTLLRAQQTATPLALARRLPLGIRDGIREISAGELEMRSDATASDQYQATALDWAAGELDSMIAGGGGGRDMLAAFDEVVAEVESSGAASAVLVSHGAAIVTWAAARAANIEAAFAAKNPLANTGVVILEGSSAAQWLALSWNGDPIPTWNRDPIPTWNGDPIPTRQLS